MDTHTVVSDPYKLNTHCCENLRSHVKDRTIQAAPTKLKNTQYIYWGWGAEVNVKIYINSHYCQCIYLLDKVWFFFCFKSMKDQQKNVNSF